MDESVWVVLGLVVGVGLIILGSRIRSRSRAPRRPAEPPRQDE